MPLPLSDTEKNKARTEAVRSYILLE